MRTVVTGGLGFIGSHLCNALAADGHDVVAVDDLSGARAPGAAPPGCEIVVAGAETLPESGLLDSADAVVHLAAVPGVRSCVSADQLAARNTVLAARLAAAAEERGARFLLASTSSVYGDAAVLPTPEDQPPAPLNGYARSKVAAERDCPHAIVARLFTVYGPGQRPDMAFARWIGALDRGEPVTWCAPERAARDFTFVDDAVRGLTAALAHGRPGQAYNIGGGRPALVKEALAELEDIIGRAARLEPLDHHVREARSTSACGRKAADELGYEPRVGLREGLERQVAAALAVRRPVVAA